MGIELKNIIDDLRNVINKLERYYSFVEEKDRREYIISELIINWLEYDKNCEFDLQVVDELNLGLQVDIAEVKKMFKVMLIRDFVLMMNYYLAEGLKILKKNQEALAFLICTGDILGVYDEFSYFDYDGMESYYKLNRESDYLRKKIMTTPAFNEQIECLIKKINAQYLYLLVDQMTISNPDFNDLDKIVAVVIEMIANEKYEDMYDFHDDTEYYSDETDDIDPETIDLDELDADDEVIELTDEDIEGMTVKAALITHDQLMEKLDENYDYETIYGMVQQFIVYTYSLVCDIDNLELDEQEFVNELADDPASIELMTTKFLEEPSYANMIFSLFKDTYTYDEYVAKTSFDKPLVENVLKYLDNNQK